MHILIENRFEINEESYDQYNDLTGAKYCSVCWQYCIVQPVYSVYKLKPWVHVKL